MSAQVADPVSGAIDAAGPMKTAGVATGVTAGGPTGAGAGTTMIVGAGAAWLAAAVWPDF
jgi:hypothetical protein